MSELKQQLQKTKVEIDAVREATQVLRLKSREAIAQVKQFYNEAAELKKQRDSENEKVQEFKKKRQEAEKKVEELKTELQALKSQVAGLPKNETPGRLRAELERLEWEQQTEAVSPKAEKELSRKINELRAQLGPAEKMREVFDKIKPIEERLRSATAEARIYRTELAKHAKASDAFHDLMLKIYKKADSLSKKIGENLKELDEKRALLDEERKEFTQIRGQIRTVEQADRAARIAEEKAERDRIQTEKDVEKAKIKQKATTLAEKALEKFRQGGKLTWDDLQAIQEAGMELK